MRNPEDSVFGALRVGFVAGTPEPLTDGRVADLQNLLELTGVGAGQVMPERLFYRSER